MKELKTCQTEHEDIRPWGYFEILSDNKEFKVKRMVVYPGQRLSYQRHFKRSEHWFVLSGKGIVTRNGEDMEISHGQSVDIPVTTWHRIKNHGQKDIVIIEIQTGDYFGEDDIERSQDDYGRV